MQTKLSPYAIITALLTLWLSLAPVTGAAADMALQQVLAGDQRTPEYTARDIYRHPQETLEFMGLRPDLTVVTTAGQPRLVPVGSQGVREVIERHQPLLSLHGHIHESRGVVRIGRTTSVNPGSEYNVGRLLGAVVDLAKGSVKNVQLVAG